jgi:uncharacterized membrane protein
MSNPELDRQWKRLDRWVWITAALWGAVAILRLAVLILQLLGH